MNYGGRTHGITLTLPRIPSMQSIGSFLDVDTEAERPTHGPMRRSSETEADRRFRRLYVDHRRDVRNYCRRRLLPADVDDAVADVFVVAWRKIDSLPVPAEMRPWIFGVARNVVRNFERGARRRQRLWGKAAATADRSGQEAGPEVAVVRLGDAEMVLAALATLKPADREILRLSKWEELAPAGIAIVLRISPAAASMRVKRASARMANALDRAGYQHRGGSSRLSNWDMK
jgi:RNA polymerase sigma-70 factor (ECF subfamily)